jgi:hypothetical protein
MWKIGGGFFLLEKMAKTYFREADGAFIDARACRSNDGAAVCSVLTRCAREIAQKEIAL